MLATARAEAPRTREFDFTYSTQVSELPRDARRVDVWLPYPVSDEHQDVNVTELSSPVSLRSPQRAGTAIRPCTSRDRSQSADLLRREHEGSRAAQGIFTTISRARAVKAKATPSGRCRSVAEAGPAGAARQAASGRSPRTVTAGKKTDLDKARAIYDYVVKTMSYDKSGTGWGNGDIYWACDAKRGNCTDFHALFIGLNRAVGIPAEIRDRLPRSRLTAGQGEIGGYHCWAEFYLDGFGWVPVDASEACEASGQAGVLLRRPRREPRAVLDRAGRRAQSRADGRALELLRSTPMPRWTASRTRRSRRASSTRTGRARSARRESRLELKRGAW